ncbi:MAG: hypothetical protein ACLR9W_03775 [Enterobacter hormaechei]
MKLWELASWSSSYTQGGLIAASEWNRELFNSYKVWPGEKSEKDEESAMAGSGPVIWNDMAMKYLGLPAHQYMMKIDSLWPLANRLDIPYHHRAILAMTYDRMYVKQEHYSLAADCIRKYLTDFPADDKYVNHWPRIAEILKAPGVPSYWFMAHFGM